MSSADTALETRAPSDPAPGDRASSGTGPADPPLCEPTAGTALGEPGRGEPTSGALARAGSVASWRDDPYTDALRAGRGPLFLRRTDGWMLPLDVERWCAGADDADLTVVRRCRGSVLDIGCGPGRLVAALAMLGRSALGVDVSPAAVARTIRTGGSALCRSVFEPLPGEGRWDTALLMDGNIGIGGDPRALLARIAELTSPDGTLLVETASADVDERVHVRMDDGHGARGTAFPWARVGTPALLRHARESGWTATDRWTAAGRDFAALRRTIPSPRANDG